MQTLAAITRGRSLSASWLARLSEVVKAVLATPEDIAGKVITFSASVRRDVVANDQRRVTAKFHRHGRYHWPESVARFSVAILLKKRR